MEGSTHNSRSLAQPSYIGDGNPGPYGGGTLTGQSLDPMVEDYMNIFESIPY